MTKRVACLGEMPHSEYIMWQALDEIRADEREAAARQQKKGMRPR